MEWISGWVQGIIIAVIIGTIIEMILPEGNCKKYIKVVIGIYILFSIISPVISKVTGNDFRVSDIFDIDQYIEASSKDKYDDLNTSQEDQIRNIYINNLKNDMKEKIQSKGYFVKDINVQVENDEQYTLKSITVSVSKQKENKEDNEKTANTVNEVQVVNKIEVKINNTEGQVQSNQDNTNSSNDVNEQKETKNSSNKQDTLSSKEQKELKQYLSSVYEIEEKNININ